jgi:hypothetical protein
MQFADDCRVEATLGEGRSGGLVTRRRGSKPTVLTASPGSAHHDVDATPPYGATHWSTRSLGRKLGFQHTIIARAWRHAGLQPDRLERYMRSIDPKLRDEGRGCHQLVPRSAAARRGVLRRRKDGDSSPQSAGPVLPLSPGRAERQGFEYYRHGAPSLYAAVNTRMGAVVGLTAARQRNEEFVGFRQTVVATQPRRREMQIVVDNLGPQNPAGPDLPGSATVGPSPLHADLFVLAQSSRTVVFQDRSYIGSERL